MSHFVTVGTALVSAIAARPNLSDITVRYGRPRFAEDVASDGERSAVWVEPGVGEDNYPYLQPGAKPVDETFTLNVAIQVEQDHTSTGTADNGQELADTRVNELLDEVQAAIQADVTLGLSTPVPLVVGVNGWRYAEPPAQTEYYFARVDVEVGVQARITAP